MFLEKLFHVLLCSIDFLLKHFLFIVVFFNIKNNGRIGKEGSEQTVFNFLCGSASYNFRYRKKRGMFELLNGTFFFMNIYFDLNYETENLYFCLIYKCF